MDTKNAVKYVGLMMSKNSVRRGESVNAMVMLINTADATVIHTVKLFAQADGGEWRLCSSREYDIPSDDHLHAYLTIPGEFFFG